MTDIKERLRLDSIKLRDAIETKNVYEQCAVGVCADEMLEAADRIEELEAKVEDQARRIGMQVEETHDAVTAERERCASAHLWPTIGQIDKKWDEISDRSYANMSQTRQWMKRFSPEARHLARWACEQYAAAIREKADD